MAPIQPEKDLRADHEAIRRTLSVLDHVTGLLREGHAVSDSDLYTLLDGLEDLSDVVHHTKEEIAVFPRLLEHPDEVDRQAIRELQNEHDAVDRKLDAVRERVEAATGGDLRARNRIAEAAEAYIETMRDLLDREEEVYLTALDSLLSREELDALGEELERLEQEDGRVDRDHFRAPVDRIAARYRGDGR